MTNQEERIEGEIILLGKVRPVFADELEKTACKYWIYYNYCNETLDFDYGDYEHFDMAEFWQDCLCCETGETDPDNGDKFTHCPSCGDGVMEGSGHQ